VIDERELQFEKQLNPRISTFRGIKIDTIHMKWLHGEVRIAVRRTTMVASFERNEQK
jgi:hypothetical protein